jgi:hypothetical protein
MPLVDVRRLEGVFSSDERLDLAETLNWYGRGAPTTPWGVRAPQR